MTKKEWITGLSKYLVETYYYLDMNEKDLQHTINEFIKSTQVYGEVMVEGFGLGHRK